MKNTSINGDLAVGRHIATGGDAVVQGNALVKRDLRIEGWLDAPNIKQPCLGLFPSLEALKSAYPLPQAGWWALVGNQIPAAVFIVADGHWIFTGNTGGSPRLDLTEISQLIHRNTNDILDLQGQIDDLSQTVSEMEENGWGSGSGAYPGQGGSSDGMTSFVIAFEQNPVYAAIGDQIYARAAIRSLSYADGGAVIPNSIRSVSIIDNATGMVLSTDHSVRPSSTSLDDYSFVLDLSTLMQGAGTMDLTITAIDDAGHQRSKALSLVVVDVTVQLSGVQTLHHSAAGSLSVGGNPKAITLFRFPNNASRQGIECVVEILYRNQWHQLGRITISDTFAHSITINPCNLLGNGERAEHGALSLRIQGRDLASGMIGNMAYTSVMCVDPANTTPIVALRYDQPCSSLRLYESLQADVAAYATGALSTDITVKLDGETIAALACSATTTQSIRRQVLDVATDGSHLLALQAQAGSSLSPTILIPVVGSAIAAQIKDGAVFDFDFSSRYNSEISHAIGSGAVRMEISGANWSSNGFCACLGEQSLLVAENMQASINYAPFGPNCQATGAVVQMAFCTNNVANSDACLLECLLDGTGTGFYVKGNKVGIYCAKGTPQLQERSIPCGQRISLAIVAEPATMAIERGNKRYSFIKMYIDGEESACLAYDIEQESLCSNAPILLDGRQGDISLFHIMAYDSYYSWQQAHNNYLVKLSDSTELVEEAAHEDVLESQGRPSLQKIRQMGIPYCVVVADDSTFDDFDSGTSTSQKYECTLYYFNPKYPCLSFRADHVQWRRQGTTSAKRPIKNERYYLAKPLDSNRPTTITLLEPDPDCDLGRSAIELAAQGYIRVTPDSIPVQIVTIKVDFSDSSGANDCGVCDMMNDTFRALGSDFMTPAQRAYDGSFAVGDLRLDGLLLDHSTKNHPIACFRATNQALTDAYFHAKGNWKEDKSEQVALGLRNTPGYNLGCLNYGDFIEFVGLPSETTIDQVENRFRMQSSLDTQRVYMLSLYCGREYRFMRHNGVRWQASSGSMRQDAQGHWQISGDVLNPVVAFELLSYEGMNWWQGVNNLDDMMGLTPEKSAWVQKLVDAGAISATLFPAWTYYFECMIDDQALAVDYALGRKVPYELYRFLRFCSACDYSSVPQAQWSAQWLSNLWKYASPHSLMAYYLFTDYLAATDQRAKNMQPMWMLEDGESVVDGVYSSEAALRMYLNKIYDCDTCNGKDNDGGCTVPSECDPDRPSVEGEYSNPYAGWGSVLFNNMRLCPEVEISDGSHLSLQSVAARMRQAQMIVDGQPLVPFSPQGAMHYFVEQRLKLWPKLLSSYDGERKYVSSISRSDAIYTYALQGLGLKSLPQFISERWRFRDGCYLTGQFYSGVLSGRIACSEDAVIRIRAAKDGYYGLGNDAWGNLSESVYLRAGQSHCFTRFSHQTGALLYIYQADRLAMLDLSQLSLDSSFDFSVLTLCQELILGAVDRHNLSIGSYAPLGTVDLGALPFLRILDMRNTTVTTINASQCPRIEIIDGSGTVLSTCTLAPGAPITQLVLPASISELTLRHLPSISYPGALQCTSFGSLHRLWIEDCPEIDLPQLLSQACQSTSLRQIRIPEIDITADPAPLLQLMQQGTIGLSPDGTPYDETAQCSGITGNWFFDTIVDEAVVAQCSTYFPHLRISNLPCSGFCFDDCNDQTSNITCLDNGSSGLIYNPGLHFQRAAEGIRPLWGKYTDGAWHGVPVSRDNYRKLFNGNDYDYTDSLSSGNDLMLLFPKLWIKGVNDYRHHRKYVFFSTLSQEPMSKAVNRRRIRLSQLDSPAEGSYTVDCQGFKQIRWPASTRAGAKARFLDPQGVVLESIDLDNVADDFAQGDYLFATVPDGATRFEFNAYPADTPSVYAVSNFSSYAIPEPEVILVDSNDVEAIEPDWVESSAFLLGAYQASWDAGRGLRSVSGASVQRGSGTCATASWTYRFGTLDNRYPPADIPNFTIWDFQNAASMRLPNYYQIVDYEMHKLVCLLWMGLTGKRDAQEVCGCGMLSATTGILDALGVHSSARTSNEAPIKCLGLENFFGAFAEAMTHSAMNIPGDWAAFVSDQGQAGTDYQQGQRATIANGGGSAVRHVATAAHSGTISALRIGRWCDVLPSVVVDGSTTRHFADYFEFSSSPARCLLRGGHSGASSAGLAYLDASHSSDYSSPLITSRLAYRGPVVVLES